MWGSDPAAETAHSKRHEVSGFRSLNNPEVQAANSFASFPVSARATMGGIHSSGSVKFHEAMINVNGNSTEPTGWVGSISKTTDGGNTWKTVFQSDLLNDYYYFNQISCSSDTHCIAVAEGDDAINGGYLVKAIVTFDGGDTWTDALTAENTPENAVSVMGAAWETNDEGWVGITTKNGRTLSTAFMKTEDGGKTFALHQTLADCYLMDMAFNDGVGVASCASSSGSSSSIAMYYV
jgi:hypothetical protein